ncbi:MAG TPA: DUF4142 domain-containing protein [Planctomycetota bacterium]|nr:DUF4142 domain-containing protein [Planctomycetota bacterium]
MAMRWLCLAAATGLALAVAGCGRKDDRETSDSKVMSGPYYNFNPADRDFVSAASEANLEELVAGRLALGKATQGAVKTFAQQMIHDHRKIHDDLDELARTKGVTLPTELEVEHKMEGSRLADLSGTEFDRAYVAATVSNHHKAVSLFEELPKKGRDPDVRAFAERTVPTLRKHLEMAQELRSKVLGSTSPN